MNPLSRDHAWIAPIHGNYTSGLQEQKSLQDWLRSPKAVITPELAHLGMQLALERSREYLDSFAYEITKALVRALTDAYPSELLTDKTASRDAVALARLAALLNKMMEPRWSTAPELTSHCTKVFDSLDAASKKQLSVVFGYRMKLSGKETDDELAKHSLWSELKQESCQFRGYVAASSRPEVWKFWLSHALLSSVMPTDADNSALYSRLSKEWRIVENAGKLDMYLSHRGKPVGLSVKAASDLRRDISEKRTAGRFVGSTAISLLADYSSSWAEQLASEIKLEALWAADATTPIETRTVSIDPLYRALPSDYPTRNGFGSRPERVEPSAFEIGLVFWWKRIREPTKPPFGNANANYSRLLAANWWSAALDGFSSHLQWSDALRFEADSIDASGQASDDTCCTRKIAGPGAIYAVLGYEMESAMKAFEPAIEIVRRSSSNDSHWQELRRNWLDAFNQFKAEAFKIHSGVEEVPGEVTRWWKQVNFGPSIASLGNFAVDQTATKNAPAKAHVQVARGNTGFIAPFSAGGADYDLWVPTSYLVVSLSGQPLSPQEWKKLVEQRGL